MVKTEYLRFMQTLKNDTVSDGVRKIANIILENLDTIIPLGTTKATRVKKLVALTQTHFPTAPAEITIETDNVVSKISQGERLKTLTVGPFRGFSEETQIDLNKKIVLIYGPNGSGKSSFCEALEYGLLGSTQEGKNGRFKRPEDYLKNASTDQFSPPTIKAVDSAHKTYTLTSDEEQFRFCFVEKNRIDNFSRIAAHTPHRQDELISTLFGLDNFNDFVKGFSNELDKKHIDLDGEKKKELKQKQGVLSRHEEAISTSQSELATIASEENTLANSSRSGMVFSDLSSQLGTEEEPPCIRELDRQLQEQLPPISGLKYTDLMETKSGIDRTEKALNKIHNKIDSAKEQMSFKRLYEATSVLVQVSPDKCPACKTPLTDVEANPFELAKHELENLSHLSTLETQKETDEKKLSASLREIHRVVKEVCKYTLSKDVNNPLNSYTLQEESGIDWTWWESLQAANIDNSSPWKRLEKEVKSLEKKDKKTEEANKDRKHKQANLTKRRKERQEVLNLKHRRKGCTETIQKAKTAISEFNEVNKKLIAEVATEEPIVAQNTAISTA